MIPDHPAQHPSYSSSCNKPTMQYSTSHSRYGVPPSPFIPQHPASLPPPGQQNVWIPPWLQNRSRRFPFFWFLFDPFVFSKHLPTTGEASSQSREHQCKDLQRGRQVVNLILVLTLGTNCITLIILHHTASHCITLITLMITGGHLHSQRGKTKESWKGRWTECRFLSCLLLSYNTRCRFFICFFLPI